MRKCIILMLSATWVFPFTLWAWVPTKAALWRPPPMSFGGGLQARLHELWLRGVNSRVFWAGPPELKNIALTFDDGPDPSYTPQILRILDERRVRATFFVIGRRAERHPELVRQIRQGGHEIGNHTYSHVKLTAVTSARMKQELEATNAIVKGITGQSTVPFRPPFGRLDDRCVAELSLQHFDTVLWSVDSRDWKKPGLSTIKRNVLSAVRNGSIILFHDDHHQIVEALPDIIDGLKERGFQLVTLPEMLVSPPEPASQPGC